MGARHSRAASIGQRQGGAGNALLRNRRLAYGTLVASEYQQQELKKTSEACIVCPISHTSVRRVDRVDLKMRSAFSWQRFSIESQKARS